MAQSSVSVMFQPHFDVLLDFPQRRITTTWNLTVLYDKKAEYCYWEFHLCVTWNLTVLFDKKAEYCYWEFHLCVTWNLTVLFDKKAEYCYWEFHPCVAIAKATLNEYYYRTNGCCDLITGL